MRYRTDGSGLDQLKTPILMCARDGTVVYKNDIAVKLIRLPKRSTDMNTHLDSAGKGEMAKLLENPKRTGVISVYTGDRNAKAFVTGYRWKGEDCTLWVFSDFLQSNPSSAFFSALEKELEHLGAPLCALIKDLDRQSKLAPGRSRNAVVRRVERRIDQTMEDLFSSRTDRANWRVSESLKILRDQLLSLFVEYGYHIDFEEDIWWEHRILYLNFRDFLAFYSHALTFCCELTRNRRISLSVRSLEEDRLEFKMKFTVAFPPMFTTGQKDLTELMPYVPDHQVEMLLFENLVKYCGYEVCYTFTESPRDNVEFVFRLPLTSSRGFSAPRNQEREQRLAAIDCYRFLEHLLTVMPASDDRPSDAEPV